MNEQPELTPSRIEELLDADLANIVGLVTAGQPISDAQIKRLGENRRKIGNLDELLAADIRNIAAVIAGGGTVSDAHRRRLSEHSQKLAKIAAAQAGASTSPAPETPPPAAFSLENEPASAEPAPDLVPGEYRETQKVYADRYGVSLRTVKLWVSEGRDAGKPPPLDDAEAFLDWWGEVKSNRPSAKILAAAETAKAAKAVKVGEGVNGKTFPSADGGEDKRPQAPAPPAPPRQQTTAREVGFAASLDRVRIAEAEAHGRYLDALAAPPEEQNDARTERFRKAWSELSEQLRFLEKAAPDVLAKSGEMMPRPDVRRMLGELHAPIVAGVRSLFRRVRAKAGTSASLDELERLHAEEVERLFAGLVASEFAPALPE